MRILEGHTGGVRALAYHPKENLLASGGQDGRIVLWMSFKEKQTQQRVDHTNWVRGVTFSPDGLRFASAGWDSQLIVRNVGHASGRVLDTGHDEQFWSLAYSADSSAIATGSGIGVIRICQPQPKSDPLVLRGHSMPVTQVVFIPNSRKLLSAGHDRTVREWDAIWGGEPRIVCHSPDWIRSLALSPRGDLIAVGGDAPGISVVTRADGATVAELRGHEQPVTSLAFGPDGRTLLSAGRDGMVYLWDMATHQPRETFDWGLGALYSLAVAPDGMTAAVGGADGRIVVWDLD